ncbi:MAG: universal stress protein [Gaiellaceae bacterium]
MFETIVWATDGSELADRVLPLVAELAGDYGSRVVAVHANEVLSGRLAGTPRYADEPDLRRKIAHQVGQLRQSGLHAELRVETSSRQGVVELIAAAAGEERATLIVLGTHGRSGMAAAVMGSVARGLLRVAPCPVLAVPPIHDRAPVPAALSLG